MINEKECCGCTACLHICPVNCITMQEDKEGFLYPVVDEKNCVHCHRCEKVCPIQHIDNRNNQTNTYIGYSKDEVIRKKSSSGGIFSVIAEWFLENDGVVFGAAYDENFEVHHISIETITELGKLRGSKYVQSRLENVYPGVKRFLEENRKVLFSGTACQIAGLKRYLGKDYDNLYTVDVLCHGVSAPKIWRMYLEEKKKHFDSEIKKINFRNKQNGWNNYSIEILFSNESQYIIPYYKDEYMRMFLSNIDLRDSCYACHFKEFPRISDMTIGDSWGIKKYMPDMDDDKGTSIIIVNSSNGERLFGAIRQNLKVEEATLDEVLPETSDSRKSVEKHPNRKRYLQALIRGDNFGALYQYNQKSFFQKVVGLIQYYLSNHYIFFKKLFLK